MCYVHVGPVACEDYIWKVLCDVQVGLEGSSDAGSVGESMMYRSQAPRERSADEVAPRYKEMNSS